MNGLDVNWLSFLFSLLVGLVSVVLTISNTKHNQDTKISAIRNEFLLEVREIKYKLALLEVEIKNDQDKFEYLYNDLVKALDHKASRLENMIKDINSYLEKNGNFKSRNGFIP